MKVENSADEGALTTSSMKGLKFVSERKSWANSRFCQPVGDSFQNLYIVDEGIIEAGGV